MNEQKCITQVSLNCDNENIKTDTKILFRIRHLPPFAGGDYHSCAAAEGCAGADAYGWRQVDMLSDTYLDDGGNGYRGVAAYLTD